MRFQPRLRGSMRGMSIVELMVALTIGLMVLAGLASIFASSSAARTEMERTSRQLENGRFAMELLSDDLRMAGFYGELNLIGSPAPAAMGDPCSTDSTIWNAVLTHGVQGIDNATAPLPTCLPGTVKPNTDILVVRFANTCEAGTVGCDPVVGGRPYVQVSKCDQVIAGPPSGPENLLTPYLLGLSGTVTFSLRNKECTAAANQRRYIVRIYFISTDNGKGQAIPTLKRMDLNGLTWGETALVEGIEELNLE